METFREAGGEGGEEVGGGWPAGGYAVGGGTFISLIATGRVLN